MSKKELYEYINGKSAYAGKLKDTIADIECTPGPSGYVRKVVVSDPYGNKITVTTSSSVYSLFSKYVMSANFVVYFGGSSKIDAEGTMTENLSKLASVVLSLAVKGIAMSGDKIDTSKGEKVLLIPENEDDDTVTFHRQGLRSRSWTQPVRRKRACERGIFLPRNTRNLLSRNKSYGY